MSEMLQSDNDVILQMTNICKSFPGVRALDNVSLTVRRGTVHALMGENGAGKSTLMKCLFGVYGMDSGEIFLEGRAVRFKSSREALENGVAMVHQELNQALSRSVMDNMWLGRLPRVSRLLPLVSGKRMYNDTRELFERLGVVENPRTVMSQLSVSKRQMVEIAKAVSYNSRVIVFDEPTSSLTDNEAQKLFSIIEMLKERGCGIIYISHKMEEILRISDDITVMRDGKNVATKRASELSVEEIIRLMVGRELTDRYPPKGRSRGEVLLRVSGLSARYARLTDVSFEVKKGEILGVAGLDGSGRTELLECIFGLIKRESGEIELDGRKIRNTNPRRAIKNGFALLTEERRATGIFAILDIAENSTISSLKKHSIGPFLSKRRINKATDEGIRAMRIKTPSRKTKIRTLSGGNQQKVILSRWLLTEPSVLLLDEPTRGIDVGAKYEIYKLISELSRAGKTVIMVSSEMPELLGVCERILVMSGGRLSGIVNADSTSQEEIMRLCAKYV